MNGFINRQNIAWEIISELEHRSIEMIQTEIQRKMNLRRNSAFGIYRETIKYSSVYEIIVSEEEKRKNGAKKSISMHIG